VVYLIERFFLGTHYLARLVGQRLGGYTQAAFHGSWHTNQIDGSAWQYMDIGGFLGNPATWIGLGVGAVMIATTIQMRMRRSEI
jgi:hypothetical protein